MKEFLNTELSKVLFSYLFFFQILFFLKYTTLQDLAETEKLGTAVFFFIYAYNLGWIQCKVKIDDIGQTNEISQRGLSDEIHTNHSR